MSQHEETISEICRAKEIAVVGVSDRDFGGVIYRTLKDRGYTTYPVHPARTTFAEDTCYPSLRTLPPSVKVAVVAVGPHPAEQVTRDAIAAGFTHLWYQQNKDFSSSIQLARDAGMKTVSSRCILMYAGEVSGIHRLHRFVARLLRRY